MRSAGSSNTGLLELRTCGQTSLQNPEPLDGSRARATSLRSRSVPAPAKGELETAFVTQAALALLRNPPLRLTVVTVNAGANGLVLQGEVDSASVREEMRRIAMRLPEVHQVVNRLELSAGREAAPETGLDALEYCVARAWSRLADATA